MKKRAWTLAFGLIAAASPASALTYMDVCAKALTPTEVSISNDTAAQLAYLKVKIDNATREGNTEGSINVPGYGSMTYGQAQSEERKLEQTLKLNWSVQQSQGYLAKYVSADSNSAFGSCVKQVLQRKDPVVIEVDEANDQQVVLKIYVGPNALATKLDLEVLSNGRFMSDVQRAWSNAGGGPATVIIERLNPGTHLNVLARIKSNGLQLGDDEFSMPPIITISKKEEERDVLSDVSEAKCGGTLEGVREAAGNPVAIVAKPNQHLDLGRLEVRVVENRGTEHRVWQTMSGSSINVLYNTKSDKAITAQAWCSMWAKEIFLYYIQLKVPVITTTVTVLQQPDNGSGKEMVRAPASCSGFASWIGTCKSA